MNGGVRVKMTVDLENWGIGELRNLGKWGLEELGIGGISNLRIWSVWIHGFRISGLGVLGIWGVRD